MDTVETFETIANPVNNGNNVFTVKEANAMLFCWTVNRFGEKKGGDINEVTTSANKDMLGIWKKLFAIKDANGKLIKCEAWEKVKGVYNELDQKLRLLSSPFYTYRSVTRDGVSERTPVPRRGIRIINRNAVPAIEATIKNYQVLGQEAINNFLLVYPNLIEIAKTEMQGQFRADDYPTGETIRNRFGISWSYLPFGAPANLPKEILERETAAAVEAMRATAEESRVALRQALLTHVEHLVEMLSPNPDGTAKRFHETNITKIVEFSETMKLVDLTDDNDLADLANKAKALLDGATPKQVKGDLRSMVVDGMTKVGTELKKLVGVSRKITFEEDEG